MWKGTDIIAPTEFEARTFQPLDNHSNYYAIPVCNNNNNNNNNNDKISVSGQYFINEDKDCVIRTAYASRPFQ
jgi:hypothetical protein